MISSTSVYAASAEPVTEADERAPEKESGRALRNAEARLRTLHGFRTTVIRAAGLIGGDRRPGRFLAGKENVSGGDEPVNLVHRDDIIGIILAVIQQGAWGDIFNAVAPTHPTRRDYYTQAAGALGLSAPTFLADSSHAGKEVSGRKVCEVLNYVYIHPDPTMIL